MNIAMGAGSSMLDKAFSFWQTERANKAAKRASAVQFDREHKAYQSRYQDTVKDMKLAGINPIMAATGGFSVGSGPKSSTPQVYQTPPSQTDIGQSAKSFAQAKKSEKETERVGEEVKEVRQRVKESVMRVKKVRAEKNLVSQQEHESVSRMFMYEQETAKLAQQISQIKSQTQKTDQEYNNLRKMNTQIVALTKRITAETAKLKMIAKVYEGPLGQLLAYLQEIMRSLGIPVAAAIIKRGK